MANIDPALNTKLIHLRATMEAQPPSKAVLGAASNRQQWSAGDRTGKILARIKGRIEIISELAKLPERAA
jgi:hypothetical protein